MSSIVSGMRVRVLEGRHFQSFGAGDAGVALHVDEAAGTCDVAFDGREGFTQVALRHLEAEPRWLSDQESTRTNDPNDDIADTSDLDCDSHRAKRAVTFSEPVAAPAPAGKAHDVGVAIAELRGLILRESQARAAGLAELQEGLHAEQQRLGQKQTELVSRCSALEGFKEQCFKESADSREKSAHDHQQLASRLDSLDKRVASAEQQLIAFGKKVTALSTALHTDGSADALAKACAETAKVSDDLSALVVRLDTLGARIDGVQADIAAGREEELSRARASEKELTSQWDQQLQAGLTTLQEKLSSEIGREIAATRSEIERVDEQAAQVVRVGEQTGLAFEAHRDFTCERDRVMDILQVRVESLAEGLAVEARLREDAFSRVSKALELEQVQPGPAVEDEARPRARSSSPRRSRRTNEEDLGMQGSPRDASVAKDAHTQSKHQRSTMQQVKWNSVPVVAQPVMSPTILHNSRGAAGTVADRRDSKPEALQQPLPARYGTGPNPMVELNQNGRAECIVPGSEGNCEAPLVPHDGQGGFGMPLAQATMVSPPRRPGPGGVGPGVSPGQAVALVQQGPPMTSRSMSPPQPGMPAATTTIVHGCPSIMMPPMPPNFGFNPQMPAAPFFPGP